jgi:hypothetical protein
MAGPRTDQDEQVDEADRHNGESTGPDDDTAAQRGEGGEHHDTELDQHPDDGQMPSDVEVQAERQEPLS